MSDNNNSPDKNKDTPPPNPPIFTKKWPPAQSFTERRQQHRPLPMMTNKNAASASSNDQVPVAPRPDFNRPPSRDFGQPREPPRASPPPPSFGGDAPPPPYMRPMQPYSQPSLQPPPPPPPQQHGPPTSMNPAQQPPPPQQMQQQRSQGHPAPPPQHQQQPPPQPPQPLSSMHAPPPSHQPPAPSRPPNLHPGQPQMHGGQPDGRNPPQPQHGVHPGQQQHGGHPGQQQQQAPPAAHALGIAAAAAARQEGNPMNQQQQQQQGPMGNAQGPPGPGGMKELRVEDALLYLDDVKKEFRNNPSIYNEFLVIMKNFKSQEVDTPGVIARVSRLFRGYDRLILGFNTFLPDGYKISHEDLKRAEAARLAEDMAAAEKKKARGAPDFMKAREMGKKTFDGSPAGIAKRFQPPGQPAQAVEFDHAISYVTTIKKRFASDPRTYHQFLEILHTYQKEQRGIKEVLEQVAHLFQDHPDLLKEFTFFLPDAVQEQAKERLHRAAAESESRLAARQQQLDAQYSRRGGAQQIIDMTRNEAAASLGPDVPRRKRTSDVAVQDLVYNSAVERQFFDGAREALSSYSRDGGQAWAEFLKCLDMYAQEILSRSEMLTFVEPLLGKRNNDLFDEFKRILSASGSNASSTQLMEDSWYSVPLAEIDFSRCRRCTPSYRALPRDYPAHPCSDRSEEEAKVLNDIWVSLPVGSEESYTFRHMRRNTYEETLFRVEDERFEIDMVIDSNRTTLQRLEPIAEEISLLAQQDFVPTDSNVKPPAEGTGLGGRRFMYTFDKKVLSVIHRNAINRIYGDAGSEMLDLMVKNPSVAIPVVVNRLRQKNEEWIKVRERLNKKQWKELAEANYYKSLDHRSLTWRTTDKRAISTRTLLGEIKDRAANGGREGKDAYRLRLDKAKEEHGTFFEVTVGELLNFDLDLTFLPKPDRRLFTPHLSFLYRNVSWAQRDAYRILAFALERGPISPADKERCHRLWVEFLGPWFDLSLNWMQKPAVTYQESAANASSTTAAASVVSEDDEESIDEDETPNENDTENMVTEELEADGKDKVVRDHHPLPAGAHVSTLYGEGKILEFRRTDQIYAIKLRFGAVGYLRPATVLCSMLPVEKSAYTRQLRADDRSKLPRPDDQLAFGTQSLYLFFRLHQILVDRLNTAKRLAFSVGDEESLQTMVEQMPNANPKAVGRRRYEAYVALVYALLEGGNAEGGKYEDRVRSLLGHGAYALATMDKLVSHICKDVVTMANDETMWNLAQLYRRHSLAGSFQPEAFRQEAAYLSDGEPMYAFQYCPMSSTDVAVLHMEYLGVMEDEDDEEDAQSAEQPVEGMEVETTTAAPTEEPSSKRQKR